MSLQSLTWNIANKTRALRKPSISQTAREHAQSVIDDLEGNQPAQGDHDKEAIRRTAGLKAYVSFATII